MKDINVPFSLYDFFAILFPGFLGVLSIYLFIDPTLHNLNLYSLSLNNINEFIMLIILIVTCYFVGHIFNTLGHFFIERPATRFLGWAVNIYLTDNDILQNKGIRGFLVKDGHLNFPKRVFEYTENRKIKPIGMLTKSCVETTFGKINKDYGYVFRLIHAYVKQFAPYSAGDAKVFTATAAMYESLTVAFTLMGIALLKGMFTNQIILNVAIIPTLILFLLSALCFSSSRRYKRMWVETIYAAFVSIVKSQKNTKKISN